MARTRKHGEGGGARSYSPSEERPAEPLAASSRADAASEDAARHDADGGAPGPARGAGLAQQSQAAATMGGGSSPASATVYLLARPPRSRPGGIAAPSSSAGGGGRTAGSTVSAVASGRCKRARHRRPTFTRRSARRRLHEASRGPRRRGGSWRFCDAALSLRLALFWRDPLDRCDDRGRWRASPSSRRAGGFAKSSPRGAHESSPERGGRCRSPRAQDMR